MLKGLAYAVLVGDIHLDGDRSSGTEVLVEIRSQLLRTIEIDVGSDNVRAILRHALADGRTDASRRSGHQRHVPRELALRRCQLELVLLQRPVFDGIALGITERDKASTGLCSTHDRNRPVVELSGDAGHHRILAGREHPYAGDDNDTWVRIGCGIRFTIDRYGSIRIEVLLRVCIQVVTILCYIGPDTRPQGLE